ncbi:uncharacterized protein LOC144098508 isoform X3 [Amblyomma americanum]
MLPRSLCTHLVYSSVVYRVIHNQTYRAKDGPAFYAAYDFASKSGIYFLSEIDLTSFHELSVDHAFNGFLTSSTQWIQDTHQHGLAFINVPAMSDVQKFELIIQKKWEHISSQNLQEILLVGIDYGSEASMKLVKSLTGKCTLMLLITHQRKSSCCHPPCELGYPSKPLTDEDTAIMQRTEADSASVTTPCISFNLAVREFHGANKTSCSREKWTSYSEVCDLAPVSGADRFGEYSADGIVFRFETTRSIKEQISKVSHELKTVCAAAFSLDLDDTSSSCASGGGPFPRLWDIQNEIGVERPTDFSTEHPTEPTESTTEYQTREETTLGSTTEHHTREETTLVSTTEHHTREETTLESTTEYQTREETTLGSTTEHHTREETTLGSTTQYQTREETTLESSTEYPTRKETTAESSPENQTSETATTESPWWTDMSPTPSNYSTGSTQSPWWNGTSDSGTTGVHNDTSEPMETWTHTEVSESTGTQTHTAATVSTSKGPLVRDAVRILICQTKKTAGVVKYLTRKLCDYVIYSFATYDEGAEEFVTKDAHDFQSFISYNTDRAPYFLAEVDSLSINMLHRADLEKFLKNMDEWISANRLKGIAFFAKDHQGDLNNLVSIAQGIYTHFQDTDKNLKLIVGVDHINPLEMSIPQDFSGYCDFLILLAHPQEPLDVCAIDFPSRPYKEADYQLADKLFAVSEGQTTACFAINLAVRSFITAKRREREICTKETLKNYAVVCNATLDHPLRNRTLTEIRYLPGKHEVVSYEGTRSIEHTMSVLDKTIDDLCVAAFRVDLEDSKKECESTEEILPRLSLIKKLLPPKKVVIESSTESTLRTLGSTVSTAVPVSRTTRHVQKHALICVTTSVDILSRLDEPLCTYAVYSSTSYSQKDHSFIPANGNAFRRFLALNKNDGPQLLAEVDACSIAPDNKSTLHQNLSQELVNWIHGNDLEGIAIFMQAQVNDSEEWAGVVDKISQELYAHHAKPLLVVGVDFLNPNKTALSERFNGKVDYLILMTHIRQPTLPCMVGFPSRPHTDSDTAQMKRLSQLSRELTIPCVSFNLVVRTFHLVHRGLNPEHSCDEERWVDFSETCHAVKKTGSDLYETGETMNGTEMMTYEGKVFIQHKMSHLVGLEHDFCAAVFEVDRENPHDDCPSQGKPLSRLHLIKELLHSEGISSTAEHTVHSTKYVDSTSLSTEVTPVSVREHDITMLFTEVESVSIPKHDTITVSTELEPEQDITVVFTEVKPVSVPKHDITTSTEVEPVSVPEQDISVVFTDLKSVSIPKHDTTMVFTEKKTVPLPKHDITLLFTGEQPVTESKAEDDLTVVLTKRKLVTFGPPHTGRKRTRLPRFGLICVASMVDTLHYLVEKVCNYVVYSSVKYGSEDHEFSAANARAFNNFMALKKSDASSLFLAEVNALENSNALEEEDTANNFISGLLLWIAERKLDGVTLFHDTFVADAETFKNVVKKIWERFQEMSVRPILVIGVNYMNRHETSLPDELNGKCDLLVLMSHMREPQHPCKIGLPSKVHMMEDTDYMVRLLEASKNTTFPCISMNMAVRDFYVGPAAEDKETCKTESWQRYDVVCGTDTEKTDGMFEVARTPNKTNLLTFESKVSIQYRMSRLLGEVPNFCVAAFQVEMEDAQNDCPSLGKPFSRLLEIKSLLGTAKEAYKMLRRLPLKGRRKTGRNTICIHYSAGPSLRRAVTALCDYIVFAYVHLDEAGLPVSEKRLEGFLAVTRQTKTRAAVAIDPSFIDALITGDVGFLRPLSTKLRRWSSEKELAGLALISPVSTDISAVAEFSNTLWTAFHQSVKDRKVLIVGVHAFEADEHVLKRLGRVCDFLVFINQEVKPGSVCRMHYPAMKRLVYKDFVRMKNIPGAISSSCFSVNLAVLGFHMARSSDRLVRIGDRCIEQKWTSLSEVCPSGNEEESNEPGMEGLIQSNRSYVMTYETKRTTYDKVVKFLQVHPDGCLAIFGFNFDDLDGRCPNEPAFPRVRLIADLMSINKTSLLSTATKYEDENKKEPESKHSSLLCAFSESAEPTENFPGELCSYLVYQSVEYSVASDAITVLNKARFKKFRQLPRNSGTWMLAAMNEFPWLKRAATRSVFTNLFVKATKHWISEQKIQGIAMFPDALLPPKVFLEVVKRTYLAFKNKPVAMGLVVGVPAKARHVATWKKFSRFSDVMVFTMHRTTPDDLCQVNFPSVEPFSSRHLEEMAAISRYERNHAVVCMSVNLAVQRFRTAKRDAVVGDHCIREEWEDYARACAKKGSRETINWEWLSAISTNITVTQTFEVPKTLSIKASQFFRLNPKGCLALFNVDYDDPSGMCESNQPFPRLTALANMRHNSGSSHRD